MKICVISYDFWDYDRHIAEALRAKGIDAHHLKMSAYRHPNLAARLKNTASKVFFNKNIKNEKRQEMILDGLKKLGKQDKVLVINPESIEPKFHEKIKPFAGTYIAYLYDALARNPAEKVLPYFDKIFSFDKNDIAKHGFQETTNYNYLPEKKSQTTPELDLIYIGSYDERMEKLDGLANKLDGLRKKYSFIIIGKKAWKKKLVQKKGFLFGTERIPHSELPQYYDRAKVILDLVREGQSGLSFRVFEAMALKKKIITTNSYITQYDFFNPENILVLNANMSNMTEEFFETPYQDLPREIYEKYTIQNWVGKIFEL